MIRLPIAMAILLALILRSPTAEEAEVRIGYLHRPGHKETISLIEMPAAENGLAGAQLAVEDNNTTGRFLNQRFKLEDVRLGEQEDAGAAAVDFAEGVPFVVADLTVNALLAAADAARGLLFFNAGALDDRLREQDCRANVMHAAPTRSMLADGLAQYLGWKQWRRWLLVVGSYENDRHYADALRRAAGRFGAKIVQERLFQDTGGARRTDSGIVQIQRQIPVFTQQAPAYDVLVAADESKVFAAYLPYRTWDPRPVAGSAGLVPTSWDGSHDLWGAVQLQNRFLKMTSRRMTALDMQAWTAVRMIGESATQTHSVDEKPIAAFLRSPDFVLVAFKGQKLTLRDWNLQLRQPVLLADGRTIVSVSPHRGISPSGDRARHAGLRSRRDEMPPAMTQARMRCRGAAVAWLALAPHARAFLAYVSNEKGNTVTVIDTDRFAAVKTVKVGQRPRGIELTRPEGPSRVGGIWEHHASAPRPSPLPAARLARRERARTRDVGHMQSQREVGRVAPQ